MCLFELRWLRHTCTLITAFGSRVISKYIECGSDFLGEQVRQCDTHIVPSQFSEAKKVKMRKKIDLGYHTQCMSRK